MKIVNCKLKIGINGYFLSRPYTGFGVYTTSLIQALDSQIDNKDTEIVVFSPVKHTGVKFHNIRLRVLPEKKIPSSLAKIWWEQVQLPRALNKEKIKLIHHLYPATFVVRGGIKQITSIHDATPWHFREHNLGVKVKLLRWFMLWSNQKADLVITVSNYAKDDVFSVYKLPKDKIKVVYNGVAARYRRRITLEGKKNIAMKYNLKTPYIFYVGGFEIHKNVRRLFLAFAQASKQIEHNLVVAGGVFSRARKGVYQDYFALPKLIAQYNLKDRVKMVGVVPDQDLPALYQAADLFLMLSLAEGFNLPIVQAFASKTPVVAAKNPASFEIAGSGALLVDAQNPDAIAAAIIRVLTDNRLRTKLIAEGLDRQRQFNWGDSARRLLEIYRKLV